MPACTARSRISPAVMKLSCPTNSPGAYADTRARCSARSKRRAIVLPHGRHRAPAGLPTVAPRASVTTSQRRGAAGPATGLIAQVVLLAVLAGTAGLGAAGWVVGVACAVTIAAALARGLARSPEERLGPASWVTLARATLAVGVAALVADSFTRATPVALLVTLAAVALALDLVDGWVARRTGTATRAGRALRRRGRRLPDPRPQRLRRPRVRRVGARDRSGALRVRGRRVAAAVDARAAAAAPLAQGRRGGAGDRADRRGRRRPAPGAHAGLAARRARRARGVGGRVRLVAVAPPASRRTRAAARARAAAHGRRRGAHGPRRCWSSGPRSSRRTSRAASPRRVRCGSRSSSSSSSPWPSCCPPPRAACWPWSWERC